MKNELKIYTSYVSQKNLDLFIHELNLLPTFVIRNISNSKLIGDWSGTSVHLKNLAPSTELYKQYKNENIDLLDYKRKYLIELATGDNDYIELIKRLSWMADFSKASGIVLLGYQQNPEECHRCILSDFLNDLGLLKYKIEELCLL